MLIHVPTSSKTIKFFLFSLFLFCIFYFDALVYLYRKNQRSPRKADGVAYEDTHKNKTGFSVNFAFI